VTLGFTEDEIRRLRAETPGCAEVAHFNNAGSSLPPAPVLETHLAYLRREALIGGYEAQEEAQPRLDAVYAATARLVGGSGPDEVALFENATRAFAWRSTRCLSPPATSSSPPPPSTIRCS